MIKVAESENVIANRVKGQLTFDRADFECDARHAVDDAGGFVLPDCGGAVLAHREQALRPVPAHSGEDHADGFAAGRFGDRGKQDVYGRPVAADEIAFAETAAERTGADHL